jgi:hypothetical protein
MKALRSVPGCEMTKRRLTSPPAGTLPSSNSMRSKGSSISVMRAKALAVNGRPAVEPWP